MKKIHKNAFGWSTGRTDWLEDEVDILQQAADHILDLTNRALKNGSGYHWMNRYLGNVNLIHNPFARSRRAQKTFLANNMAPGGNRVLLNPSWRTDPRGPISILLHELGHVVDNRSSGLFGAAVWFGGGMGDKLALHMGADPLRLRFSIRFMNGCKGIPEENRWQKGPYGWPQYGNTSTADYFAHTFMFSILDPNAAPPGAVEYLNWMIEKSWD
jgi:hypothetical protein